MGRFYNNNNNNSEYASLPYMGFSSLCNTQIEGTV
jgi:hypothetical protein